MRFTDFQSHDVPTLRSLEWVRKYCTCEMVLDSEDGSGKKETRNVGLGPNGLLAGKTFNETGLYKQLWYLKFLLDVKKHWEEVPGKRIAMLLSSIADLRPYDEILQRASANFDANLYRLIDLWQFFMPLVIC